MDRDQADIRQAIELWALCRDSGDWDAFAEIWHPEGWMVTTWFEASGADFVARSRKAWTDGIRAFHLSGGARVTIEGSRAISETRMEIIQRAPVHEVLVDVTCLGRFWDAWEKTEAGWKLVLRQPIYEIDRMAPASPGASLTLDPDLLASFPEGYRHLGYLQTGLGLKVNRNLPGTRGPEIEALQARGRRYLAGDARACLRRPS